ncbi:hypothetical protein HK100_009865 [Physocladia obscura]|uniref:Uncharacterized protein n=1 Tax=Physocladia obscura TaxID=109957 RepID=A0AAD5XHF4_9FUNG|nr:hypothetical protein HK100_009865 [Physocladia obscura]
MIAELGAFPQYHIDYRQWGAFDPASESSLQFIVALRKAAVGLGFFYLHNTPLSDNIRRERMFFHMKNFFALPLETRLQIDMTKSRHFRGYAKFGQETTYGRQDMRDQINYGPEEEETSLNGGSISTKKYANFPVHLLETLQYLNLLGPNQFLPDSVTIALEIALGVEKGRLTKVLDGNTIDILNQNRSSNSRFTGPLPFAHMKTLRYPVGSIVDGIHHEPGTDQGVGPHKDGGWLTLLATTQVPVLQVQDFNTGSWLSIEHATRGIVQATAHRVVVEEGVNGDTGDDRFSVALFRDEWRCARRQEIISDVPKGNLFPESNEENGKIASRTFLRSIHSVVDEYYSDK